MEQQAVNRVAVELIGLQPALLLGRILELPLDAIDLIAQRKGRFHQSRAYWPKPA